MVIFRTDPRGTCRSRDLLKLRTQFLGPLCLWQCLGGYQWKNHPEIITFIITVSITNIAIVIWNNEVSEGGEVSTIISLTDGVFCRLAVRLPPTKWLYTTLLLHPTLDYYLLPNNIFHVGSNWNRTHGSVYIFFTHCQGTSTQDPYSSPNAGTFLSWWPYWIVTMSHCVAGVPSPSSMMCYALDWVPPTPSSSSQWCDTCDLLCGLKPAHVWVPTRGLTGANGNGYAAEKWCPSF